MHFYKSKNLEMERGDHLAKNCFQLGKRLAIEKRNKLHVLAFYRFIMNSQILSSEYLTSFFPTLKLGHTSFWFWYFAFSFELDLVSSHQCPFSTLLIPTQMLKISPSYFCIPPSMQIFVKTQKNIPFLTGSCFRALLAGCCF